MNYKYPSKSMMSISPSKPRLWSLGSLISPDNMMICLMVGIIDMIFSILIEHDAIDRFFLLMID